MRIHEHANLISGILFTLLLGTLLHFLYQWSGENAFMALFSPVNESVWEHLKLLFFPTLLYTLFEIIALSKTSRGFLAFRCREAFYCCSFWQSPFSPLPFLRPVCPSSGRRISLFPQ